ncbi:hypothetical protein ACHAWF_008679 [Thalassiosira exigua]
MGAAPSIAELSPEYHDILQNITREDIVRSSRKKCRVEEKSVYLDGDFFDLDEHVPMALAILRAHPHLKDIRFKLVPGRMTEEKYWAALFGILHDGGIDLDGMVGKIDDDYETGDEVDGVEEMEDEGEIPHPVAQDSQEHAYYDDDVGGESKQSNTSSRYLEEIKAQQAHNNRLQKSLREANHKTRQLAMELHKERKKVNGEVSNGMCNQGEDHPSPLCSRCSSSLAPEQPHSGTWEMHQDCKEFLKLDDHLKENLRKEKEKRLKEVLDQMKFILDTDYIKDSYGKWTCCGKEEYNADCTE